MKNHQNQLKFDYGNSLVTSKEVLTTKDYFMFKPIDGNRALDQLHVKKLHKSMKDSYLFTVIIVNEKYEIIDGQHRFEVLKELNLPLNYIICYGYGLDEVHILNKISKKWNSDDYMNGYADLGIENYVIYRNFKNKYKFGHDECMAMLSGVNSGHGKILYDFRNGSFKIVDIEEANMFAERLWSLSDLYPGFKRRHFIYTMLALFDNKNFEFDQFVSKLKLQRTMLTDCVDTKQYLALIEEIYNYKRKEKVNLRYYNNDAK
jgi:hypothetical protein